MTALPFISTLCVLLLLYLLTHWFQLRLIDQLEIGQTRALFIFTITPRYFFMVIAKKVSEDALEYTVGFGHYL